MPKENTHLYFTNDLLDQLQDDNLVNLIKNNLKYFHLGSISPDVFYYSKNDSVVKFSDYLHGQDGNLTNEIVFNWLDVIREQKDEPGLIFIMGYLSHCALDIIFHPIIYYFSGNYYDPNPEKREKAIYLHRHLETYLDKLISGDQRLMKKLINLGTLNNLNNILKVIEDKYKISYADSMNAYQRNLSLNKLFSNNLIYKIIYFLNKLGLSKNKANLALCYGNLKKDKTILPQKFLYKDLITGLEHETEINKLFAEALNLSAAMLMAAFKFYKKEISYAEAVRAIAGKSLDTGTLNGSVQKIKYLS